MAQPNSPRPVPSPAQREEISVQVMQAIIEDANDAPETFLKDTEVDEGGE